MNAQDFRSLQEAYLGVYENSNNEPDPFGRPGGKHGGVKKGGGYEKGYNAMMKRIKELDKKEEYDLYDIILTHLLDEGYADTEQAAEAIMVNMSEEWRESICEAEIEPPKERVGALTNIDIPMSEREAARQRTLAKAKAKREKNKN
jgi:hypothetical protein